jgi:predicted N-acetyltransferase YhbS
MAPTFRPATPADVPAITALVDRAYALYVERIGRRPAPMEADHAAEVAGGQVHVAEEDGAIVGLIVLVPAPDHLLVENVAVAPERQGEGLGRALLELAADEGRRLGVPELRLYTNAKMYENLERYPHLGWTETGRSTISGFDRVSFRRPL